MDKIGDLLFEAVCVLIFCGAVTLLFHYSRAMEDAIAVARDTVVGADDTMMEYHGDVASLEVTGTDIFAMLLGDLEFPVTIDVTEGGTEKQVTFNPDDYNYKTASLSNYHFADKYVKQYHLGTDGKINSITFVRK